MRENPRRVWFIPVSDGSRTANVELLRESVLPLGTDAQTPQGRRADSLTCGTAGNLHIGCGNLARARELMTECIEAFRREVQSDLLCRRRICALGQPTGRIQAPHNFAFAVLNVLPQNAQGGPYKEVT